MVNKELQIDGGGQLNAEARLRTGRRGGRRGRNCAEEWESDRDGGLGTSLFALLCGREVEVRPGFYRGPAVAVNSGECAVPVRGDGSPILPGGEPRRIQRTREARELEREYMIARC